jgi:hypothetical protein
MSLDDIVGMPSGGEFDDGSERGYAGREHDAEANCVPERLILNLCLQASDVCLQASDLCLQASNLRLQAGLQGQKSRLQIGFGYELRHDEVPGGFRVRFGLFLGNAAVTQALAETQRIESKDQGCLPRFKRSG